ncbi:MAG: NADH-quinone oxidoreductase subunit M, partial [Thermomicrobiaceae bacterium]
MDSLPILSLMTYSPLVGALVILFWANAPANTARWIALIAASISLVFSLIMLAAFDRGASGMQLT